MSAIKVTRSDDGFNVVIRPSQRWISIAVTVAWLALIATQIPMPSHEEKSSSVMGFFLTLNFLGGGVYIVWQLVAKEMLFLRPEVIGAQKMLGPFKLEDVREVQRKSITDVVVKEHRFRAKSRDYVKRRVVLETSEGDVELPMGVSMEDGEALRKIILEAS